MGAIRRLAESWHPEKLEVGTRSTSLELCEKFVFDLARSVSRLVSLVSLSKPHPALDAHWLHTCFSSKLRRIHGCYVLGLADDFKSVVCFGSNRL